MGLDLFIWPAGFGWRCRYNGVQHWAFTRKGATAKGLREAKRQKLMAIYEIG